MVYTDKHTVVIPSVYSFLFRKESRLLSETKRRYELGMRLNMV